MPKTLTAKKILKMKLSDILELALNDLKKVEADKKNFAVDMKDLAYKNEDGKCAVCLAGSVLAQSCQIPADKLMDDEVYLSDEENTLVEVVDSLRTGDLEEISYFTHRISKLADRFIPDYEDSPKEFRAAMKELIADLRALKE